MKEICRVSIFHLKWESVVLYNSSSNTHTPTHSQPHTHHLVIDDAEQDRHSCEKKKTDRFETVFKQVEFKGVLNEEEGQECWNVSGRLFQTNGPI